MSLTEEEKKMAKIIADELIDHLEKCGECRLKFLKTCRHTRKDPVEVISMMVASIMTNPKYDPDSRMIWF